MEEHIVGGISSRRCVVCREGDTVGECFVLHIDGTMWSLTVRRTFLRISAERAERLRAEDTRGSAAAAIRATFTDTPRTENPNMQEDGGKVTDGSLLGDANGLEPGPGRVKDSGKWQKPRFSRKALMKCCLVKWIIASTQPQDKDPFCLAAPAVVQKAQNVLCLVNQPNGEEVAGMFSLERQ
ncbi:unnamed protein product [Arctogadus glacialis]